MPSPTWHFDGALRRVYEVPPGASYTVDGDGYRIYDGGINAPLLTTDVKKDLWSRWVDWHALHDWALLAFMVSGGTVRPTGENSPADFTLRTSVGWRIVLANYPHETIFAGNLFPEGVNSLFDNTRLTNVGIVPRLSGSANLLTYSYATGGGSGGASAEDIAIATVTALQAIRLQVNAVEGAFPSAAVIRDTLLAASLGPRSLAAHLQSIATVLLGEQSGAGTTRVTYVDGPVSVAADVPLPGAVGNRANVEITGV